MRPSRRIRRFFIRSVLIVKKASKVLLLLHERSEHSPDSGAFSIPYGGTVDIQRTQQDYKSFSSFQDPTKVQRGKGHPVTDADCRLPTAILASLDKFRTGCIYKQHISNFVISFKVIHGPAGFENIVVQSDEGQVCVH